MIATNAKKIWLSSPHMGGREQFYVNEAFQSNWVAPLGPNVQGFEADITSYLGGTKHVAALSSGTAAIHLALILCGVSHGDLVICQSFTFAASANPITYLGAEPVFIDSELSSWNVSPELLETAIIELLKSGKKPKAILAVHLYGMPYDADRINSIAAQYQIPVIEDSAEALGSEYKERKCGTLGDYSILSFNGNKIITTSGGGALVTSSKTDKQKAIFLATQARDEAPHYQHSEIGYNYRMSNVVAGIGRGQMEVLPERVEARKNNYNFYRQRLGRYDDISFQPAAATSCSNRWLTCVLFRSATVREKVRKALLSEQIESRPLWKPMHLQPVFKNSKTYLNGNSEDLFARGLCLPSGSNLEEEDLSRIAGIIEKHNEDDK